MQDGLYLALAAMFPHLPPLVLIAIAELMTYVCTAVVRGRHWRGQTKWYISNNSNTVGWLRDRTSPHPIVQFLFRILGIAQSTWGFSSVSVYIRTYHNLVPDNMTREKWKEAVALLEKEGFVRVEIGEAWKFYMTELHKQHEANLGALVAMGGGAQEERLARQLAERRGRRGMHKEMEQGSTTQLLELFSSTGSFARSWRAGRRVVVPVTPEVGALLSESRQGRGFDGDVVPWEEIGTTTGPTVIAYSGGGARVGIELRLVRRALEWRNTIGFLIDLPLGDETGPKPLWKCLVPSRGWAVQRMLLNSGNHGGSQRRWRLLLLGWRK